MSNRDYKPVGIRADLYEMLKAEADSRGVSIYVVATEKMEAGLQAAPVASTKPQDGKKRVGHDVEQMLGVNLL